MTESGFVAFSSSAMICELTSAPREKASLGIAEARAGSAGAGDPAEDIRTNLDRLRERIARAAERAGRRAEDVLVGVSKTMEV